MKGAIVLAAAGLVAAQLPDISNVPQCAITCLLPALTSTGCSLADLTCACKSENQDKIRSQATPCIEKGCSKDDSQKALEAANSLCGGGVSGIPSGSVTSTGAASTGSQSTSAGSASESSSAVITSSATPTSGAGGIVPPVTSAVSSGHSTALPGNGTATTRTSSRSASGSSSATSSGSQTSSTAPGTNDAAGPVAGVVAAIAAAVFALLTVRVFGMLSRARPVWQFASIWWLKTRTTRSSHYVAAVVQSRERRGNSANLEEGVPVVFFGNPTTGPYPAICQDPTARPLGPCTGAERGHYLCRDVAHCCFDNSDLTTNTARTATNSRASRSQRRLPLPTTKHMAADLSDVHMASPPTLPEQNEPRWGGYSRFEIELEFVQSLANPFYLNHLASQKLLTQPAFVAYLAYLRYWSRPPYLKYLTYPGPTLRHLELLQQERFRQDIMSPDLVARLVEEGMRSAVQWHREGAA
ncbi:hypothetical protein ARSEF4850_005219 [Beauveria asiatica]